MKNAGFLVLMEMCVVWKINLFQKKNILIKKADWCPIRDLPRRKIFLGLDGASDAMEIRERGRQEGFNACIDEILKGANGNE